MSAVLGLALLAPTALAQHMAPGAFADLTWRMVGPMRGGRTHALAGVGSQPNVFYVGAVNGGVWKTDDAGRTWWPIFDEQPTQSIGAIAVAPSNPDIVYVASGEGALRPDLSVGNGIYRSRDGGRTWTHLGLTGGQQIPALAVDPRDPKRLFAAVFGRPYGPSAERGIYRSIDAGATWHRVLYTNEDTGGSAVAIDPAQPQVVYAGLWQARLGASEDLDELDGTGGGFFKSTDGGNTWRRITAGLPANLTQINFDVAASAPRRLYAAVGTTEAGHHYSATGLGIFRSDDAGESWTRITTDARPALRIGGGGFELPVVRVDPENPDVVYSAGPVTMKSTDGGRSWEPLRGAVDDDYQNLWISPADPRIIALVSDQGAVITVNGGKTWSSWFNQPTAQLYHVGVTPTFPYRVCSGQEESGSVCIASRGNDGSVTERDWRPVGANESGYVAPDPLDPDVIYGAGAGEVSKFHLSTGQVQNVTPIPLRAPGVRAGRTTPLIFSPLDAHTLYYAANRLYRTTDGGVTWQTMSPDLARAGAVPTSAGKLLPKAAEAQRKGAQARRGVIYSLGLSPLDPAQLWAGTDDGLVWLSTDGGGNWTNVTPPELIPWSKVTQIEASHFDPHTAYISVSRMAIDDLHPYIYRTGDRGATWQPIIAGLPVDAPANTVREDPQRRGLLFAATESAVWISFDDGDHWDSLQLNLPHTSVRDLWIHQSDLIAATHGRSFWILDDITRLRQLPLPAMREAMLFRPSVAYRMHRSTWPDTAIPPDEPLAENPAAGAILEFFLPRDAQQVLVLEVLDGSGAVVRRFRSDDAPQPSADELTRELMPPYWIKPPAVLPAHAGVHRWVWDLRFPAPESVTHDYPISAVPHATPRQPQGPLALPGSYRVRLTYDGTRLEAPLTLKPDPRVSASAEALAEQLRLATRLAGLLSRSSHTLLLAQSQEAQLESLAPAFAAAAGGRTYQLRLAELTGSADTRATPPPPTLREVNGLIMGLYAEVTRGDAAPTAAQLAATEDLQQRLNRLMDRWQNLQAHLAELNSQLRAAKLTPVRPDLAPPRDANLADKE